MKTLLALAALSLIACSSTDPSPPTDLTIGAVDPALAEAVDAAAAEWSAACGYRIDRAPSGVTFALGEPKDEQAPYTVRTANLVAHAMGHALGLQHAAQGVMRADAPTSHVTVEDCQ